MSSRGAVYALLAAGALLVGGGCPDSGGSTADTSVEADVQDTTVGDTEEPDAGADVDLPDSGAPDALDDTSAADTAEPGDGFVPTEPGVFVPGTAKLADEFVFKGVWAGEAGAIVAVGNEGVVASRTPAGAWSVLARAEGAELLNAVAGADGDHLWAVGKNGTTLPGTRDSFGESATCTTPADCDDSDPCTLDLCTAGVCAVTPAGGVGCCGTSPGSWDFESGALAPWTITAKTGPLTWSVVTTRAAGGTHSVYFGDPTQSPPSYDVGVQVTATLVSPTVKLPTSGAVGLSFQLFLDAETDASFDTLTLEVVGPSGVSSAWSKAELFPIPTNGFVPVDVDLTPWRGSNITLRFRFDSIDGTINSFEGVYLDDITLTSTCTGGGTASSQSGPTLWGVAAVSNELAYAVGQNGTILEYNGTSWSAPKVGDTGAIWNGVAGKNGHIALVGTSGRVSVSTGTALHAVQSGTTATLWEVDTVDGDVYWAVGDGGTILRGEGDSWSVVQGPTTASLRDVFVVANDDVWVVGYLGVAAHFDGLNWSTVSVEGTPNLSAVWVSPSGLVTATGTDGVVLQGGLAGLASVGTYHTGGELLDIFGTGDDLLLVGTGGRVVAYRGGAWVIDDQQTSQTLEAAFGFAPDDLWAVGRAGTAIHWDGTVWTRVEVPVTASLNALWGETPSSLLAAGSGGALLQWTGAEWVPLIGSTTANLRAVFARAAGDVWAVGAGATIMHNTWIGWAKIPVQKIPTADGAGEEITDELHAVWAAAADDAWAVGAGGRILRWDGSTWSRFETDFGITLRGLYGLAGDDIFAVGNEGFALHWNGREWEQVTTGSIATLHAIHGDGVSQVIAVGALGTVLTLQR